MSEETRQFLYVATLARIRSWRQIISFGRMVRRVEKQAGQSEGLVKYAVKGSLRNKFYTLSIWKDRGSMIRFMRAEPHATAVKRFQEEWGREGFAVEWESSDIKLDWDEAKTRLRNPTHHFEVGKKYLQVQD